eukprot:1117863-Prorocentrum_minimum.AAC.4
MEGWGSLFIGEGPLRRRRTAYLVRDGDPEHVLVEGTGEVDVEQLPVVERLADDTPHEAEVHEMLVVHGGVGVGLERVVRGGSPERVLHVEHLAREHRVPLARNPTRVDALLPLELHCHPPLELLRRPPVQLPERVLQQVRRPPHADANGVVVRALRVLPLDLRLEPGHLQHQRQRPVEARRRLPQHPALHPERRRRRQRPRRHRRRRTRRRPRRRPHRSPRARVHGLLLLRLLVEAALQALAQHEERLHQRQHVQRHRRQRGGAPEPALHAAISMVVGLYRRPAGARPAAAGAVGAPARPRPRGLAGVDQLLDARGVHAELVPERLQSAVERVHLRVHLLEALLVALALLRAGGGARRRRRLRFHQHLRAVERPRRQNEAERGVAQPPLLTVLFRVRTPGSVRRVAGRRISHRSIAAQSTRDSPVRSPPAAWRRSSARWWAACPSRASAPAAPARAPPRSPARPPPRPAPRRTDGAAPWRSRRAPSAPTCCAHTPRPTGPPAPAAPRTAAAAPSGSAAAPASPARPCRPPPRPPPPNRSAVFLYPRPPPPPLLRSRLPPLPPRSPPPPSAAAAPC